MNIQHLKMLKILDRCQSISKSGNLSVSFTIRADAAAADD